MLLCTSVADHGRSKTYGLTIGKHGLRPRSFNLAPQQFTTHWTTLGHNLSLPIFLSLIAFHFHISVLFIFFLLIPISSSRPLTIPPEAQEPPVLNLLRDAPQSISHTLNRKTPQQQPQRWKTAMSKLPHQLRRLHRRRRLLVAEPLHHPFRMPCWRRRRRVRGRRGFDREMAESR